MKQHGFIFGGVNSLNYGVTITGKHTRNIPAFAGEFFSIPGRNGDYFQSGNRFENVEITYSCAIVNKFFEAADSFFNAIHLASGYARLEDDNDSDVYREAVISGGISVNQRYNNRSGTFDVKFMAKPQRYLKAANPIVIEGNDQIFVNNPWQDALPEITVYGTDGSIDCFGYPVEIFHIDVHVVLDCENQNAYKRRELGPSINENANVKAEQFPILHNGGGFVTVSGNIDRVEINPRWWKL